MPRKATSCLTTGVPEEQRCHACRHSKLKTKCSRNATSPSSVPQPSPLEHSPSEPSPREPPPREPSPLEPRAQEQPVAFEPADFYRRELPYEAREKGTQRQRTAELASQREVELRHAREEGHCMASKQAAAVIALARTKLMKMAEDLAVVKAARAKESAEAQAYRCTVEASKRQRTLHAFFARPLEHEARPYLPYHAISYHTIPYHTIRHHTLPYHPITYHNIPYDTTSHRTILSVCLHPNAPPAERLLRPQSSWNLPP